MKFIFVSIILSVFIYAGEMDRIEAIVQDIEKLRKDYKKCLASKEKIENSKRDLLKVTQSIPVNAKAKQYKKLLEEQKSKNSLLLSELDSVKKSLNQSKIYMKTVDDDKALYEKKLDEKEAKIVAYKANVNKLKLSLESAKKDAVSTQKKLKERDSKIVAYKANVDKLKLSLESAKKDAVSTQKKLKERDSKIIAYKANVDKLKLALETAKKDAVSTQKKLKERDSKIVVYKANVDKLKLALETVKKDVVSRQELLSKSIAKNKTNEQSIDKSNKKYKSIIKDREKELFSLKNEYKNIILDKENTIFNLENEIKEYKIALNKKPKVVEKIVEKVVKVPAKKTVCKDENKFPKLLMKEGKKQASIPVVKQPEIKVQQKTKQATQEISKKKISQKKTVKTVVPKVKPIEYAAVQVKIDTKPSVYRLNTDAKVFSDINGTVLQEWENKTSFTSTMMSQNWVKVSGHFENGKWTRVKQSLWIKKENAIKR